MKSEIDELAEGVRGWLFPDIQDECVKFGILASSTISHTLDFHTACYLRQFDKHEYI